MPDDIETTLSRELREVASRLQVPAMPALSTNPPAGPRPHRHWLPLLAAAAVVLIVSGAVVVGSILGGGDPDLEPAPPAASRTESVRPIPTSAPTVPYVLDRKLYVDGVRVPGTWWSVQAGDAGWVALRTDNTWWWGSGPEANKIEPRLDLPPLISPNGRYVALVADTNGRSAVTGFETRSGGQGWGAVPVYPGDAAAGDPVRVRAVTDDGRVIVQGAGTDLLWLPLGDNSTVDLTSTAPGQVVLAGTPDDLAVVDGTDGADGASGQPYLATISDAGELTRTSSLPSHDDLSVGPEGWLAWTPPGTTGGEVTAISALEVQTVDGTDHATLSAPPGWGFRVRAWAWEDGEHLVAPMVREGGGDRERMARCSVQPARCVLVASP